MLPVVGDRDTVCLRSKQVEDLISLVAELREVVETLGTIWECEQVLDWWSSSLPCL